jgi:leucyl-tRNA synthetase
VDRTIGLLDIAKGRGVTPALEAKFHRTVKKVTGDIDSLKMNTAIASLMTLINDIYDAGTLTVDELKIFVKMLCPFAPHVCEEIWSRLGEKTLLSLSGWVEYDEEKTKDNSVEIAIQINGKLRSTLTIEADLPKDRAIEAAKAEARIKELLAGHDIVKEILVPNKLINFVIK